MPSSSAAPDRDATATRTALELALPAPGDALEQDEEWVVVKTARGWRKIRLHDYGDVYAVPGLYERWVYDIFQCASPAKIRELLTRALKDAGVNADSLRVLDLGAGNGCVAEELRISGIESFLGVDIYEEAAQAAERDRPGLYADFVVGDLTNLADENRGAIERFDPNCLTCVAALGFGDIPPEVFAEAYNAIAPDGWVAFTIKNDFLNPNDKSGFSTLIRRMMAEDALELISRESYVHRVSTDGQDLVYEAFIGRKRADVPAAWIA
ncbi:MAG: class I SAM-dependent methyltransferase [Phycisphaerales bacterium]